MSFGGSLNNFAFCLVFLGETKSNNDIPKVGLAALLVVRVSNGTGQCNFLGQRDRQNFFVPGQRDSGTEVLSLSRDKGTTGQAQNLATGRAGTAKIWDGTRDKTGQSKK